MTLNLQADTPANLQFYNTHANGTINVLVEDMMYFNNKGQGQFIFNAFGEDGTDAIKNVFTSESSSNIQLKAIKGTYQLRVTSTLATTIHLIVAKNEFVHLTAGRTFTMNSPTIF